MISYASGLGVALCPRVPTIGFPRLFGFGFRHLTSLPILRLHSRHNSSLYTAANMELIKNPKIAVLINTPPDGTDFPSVVKECFREAFLSILPTEELDFYDPVVERKFPDASKYQLIVLSGGKIDADCSEPWVLGVLDYIRSTAHNFSKTKMLAVCWGHQAVSRAFGGQVRNVPTGSVVRIEIEVPFELFLIGIEYGQGNWPYGDWQEVLPVCFNLWILCMSGLNSIFRL